MKKLLLAALLGLSSFSVNASGPLDGIYTCVLNSYAGSITLYIAVNSNATATIVTVPSLPGTNINGYIGGSPATENYFSGTSSLGYGFYATATGAIGAKHLEAKGSLNFVGYGVISGTASCNQII